MSDPEPRSHRRRALASGGVVAFGVGAFASAIATPATAAATTATTRSPAQAIRAVDFRNGFTYEGGYGPVVVRRGTYSNDDEDAREYFEVRDVDYGDLDGDGREEAVVTTLDNTGGSGQFTDGLLYTMRSGRPALLGSLGVGDRADGGIADVIVASGRVVVDRFGQEKSGACCPEYVERTTYLWRNGALVPSGKATRRAYIDLNQGDSGKAYEIKFLRGTSSAMIAGVADGQLTGAFFAAAAGQIATVTVPPALAGQPAIRVTLQQGGTRLGSATSGSSLRLRLPATGKYQVVLTAPAADPREPPYARFELEIRS